MKLKYYLRGLGIGILVSTVILMIVFANHKADISDEEIISRAEALGMVMPESEADKIPKGTETAAPEETETQGQQTPDTQQTQDNQPANSEQAGDTGQEAGESTGQAQDTLAGASEGTAASKEITVEKGNSSNSVADKLFAEGLIDDAAAFNKYLVDNDYDSLIRQGTYTIPQGAAYEEIAKLLTGKQ